MCGLWTWIGDNSGALSAVAALAGVTLALAGVIVATAYAVLTRRLAAAAVRQAEETRRQADLTDQIATETARQAQTSRQIFEAAHRAYLELLFETETAFFVDTDFYRFWFEIKNHGPLPAVGISWLIRISRAGTLAITRESEVSRVIFPGEERPIRCEGTRHGGVVELTDAIEVDCVVRYRSASGRDYQTQIVLQRLAPREQWRVLRHEMT